MRFKKLARAIEAMPRAPYIFFRAVMAASCVVLLGSFALFASLQDAAAPSYRVYMTAAALLECPAGLLIIGFVGTAFLLDRSG